MDSHESAVILMKFLRQEAYSGGRWINARSGLRISVRNPAHGGLIGSVPSLGADEMDEAIDVAHSELSHWRHRLPRERGDILMRWRSLILENCDDLAAILTA